MGKINQGKYGVEKIFTISFLFVFLCIYFVCLFFNTNDLVHFRMIRAFYFGAFILGTILIINYLINKYREKLDWIKSNERILWGIGFLIIFTFQMIFAKGIYFAPGWDVAAIIENGKDIISNPENFKYEYFMQNPNNIFLMLIYSKVYQLSLFLKGIDYEFLLIIINIIFVDLSIIFTVLISKRIFSKKMSVATFVLFGALFAFSPWLVVTYSDTLSMLFPIAIFYLYILQKEKESKIFKYTIYLAIGILGGIGFLIKPTSIIVIIAILIVEVISSFKDFKKLLVLVCSFIILGGGFISLKYTYDKASENIIVNGVNLSDRANYELPFTHFAMMGMQSVYVENRGTLYGAYVPEDVLYTASFPSKEEKIEGNITEIKRRLNDFGVKGYLKFLFNKACWILSDGTFYYGGEGNFMKSEPYSQGEIASELQNVFLHTGEDYFSFANVLQGVWILILFLIVYPIFDRKGIYGSGNVFLIRITITGIILFVLLFEGRSRYLINYLPFFILLATYGLKVVYKRFLIELGK